jgi:membrane protease subunit (stomatin/prohibitin family)
MPLVRRGPGLVGTAARAGVAMGVAGRVQHRQQQKWAAQEQEQYAQQPQYAEPAPPAPAAEPDYAAELEKLAQLRDQGVITAEDYEAKKKQVLGI